MARGPILDEELAAERALGVRVLLASPILDATRCPAEFKVVARNRAWLAEWFETACGWQLTVDVMGGFARLAKRSATPDPTRPAHRSRGGELPFDRRRYELLCLLCAELAKHSVTTIGILADSVESATRAGPHERFDVSKRGERAAFVDAFKLLESWGVVSFSAGDVDAYVTDEEANAFVRVDSARLHRLLVSAATPSSVPANDAGEATAALAAEPRYGEAPAGMESVAPDVRTRWLRHSLARRLLDDPVVYLEDLTDAQRTYLGHPSGRGWLRARAAEAGLPLEERAEGLMALDPEGRFDDVAFPVAGGGTVAAVALMLTARFVASDDSRRLVAVVSIASLVDTVRELLRRHPGWARKYRDEGGASTLAREALDLLESLGLVRREDDLVRPMPAVARYRPTEPRLPRRQETLL
ncbi:MAG TPA: TIGR02678 family protein [Actinomycetota bacterium]|nr:TIGR02678 family protein [Actinomycetota bacterium]